MDTRSRQVAAGRPGLSLALLAVVSLVVACGHRLAAAPPVSTPAGDVGGLGWIVGRWERPGGVEHWAAAGDVLWGVGFSVKDERTVLFEVLIIEKGGGGLRYVALPNGKREVTFAAVEAGDTAARFANPQHDFPKVIAYRRDGDSLTARVEGDAPAEDYRWRRGAPGRADALEAADRAFAADTAGRGLEAWVAAFDPAGVMWNRRRLSAHSGDGIRATMEPLFARGVQIEWAPVASGLSPAGDLGYTVGTSRYTAPDASGARVETGRGSYVSIWRKQSNGEWKVLFDTGT